MLNASLFSFDSCVQDAKSQQGSPFQMATTIIMTYDWGLSLIHLSLKLYYLMFLKNVSRIAMAATAVSALCKRKMIGFSFICRSSNDETCFLY